MKTYGILLSSVVMLSSAAPAIAAVSKTCYAKSEKAVEKFAKPGYYDEEGFQAFSCVAAPKNKVIVCDVGAMKGDGEASDTFRVILSEDCKRSYRVELTGEE